MAYFTGPNKTVKRVSRSSSSDSSPSPSPSTSPSESTSKKTMSTGMIILLIFVGLIVCLIVAGLIYNFFIKPSPSSEQNKTYLINPSGSKNYSGPIEFVLNYNPYLMNSS